MGSGDFATDHSQFLLSRAWKHYVETIIHTVIESISRPHWVDNGVRVSVHAGFAQPPRHSFRWLDKLA
jgi:hypothetical protein